MPETLFAPSIPSISRLLDREPALEPAVAALLERGAALRAAARRARADTPPYGPPQTAAALAARRELDEAVAALEKAAADGPSPARPRAALARVAQALAAARAARHALFPRRAFHSVEARHALSQAQWLFERAWRALEKAASARAVRALPWRLELASHLDPAARFEEIELALHELPATPGAKRPWGERCLLTGEPFVVESVREPRLRYRSLEAAHHLLSPDAYALVGRLRDALSRLPAEGAELAAFHDSFGFLFEEYVAERAHPTFARLGLLDFPSLAVGLNNLLLAWAHRPLFGRRDGPSFAWRSYGEVRRDAFALARAFERLDLAPGARVGMLVDENAPEFYLAEMAAVLSGRTSVGLPFGLSDEALAGALTRAGIGIVVADRAGAERLRGASFADLSVVTFGGAPDAPRPRERSLAALVAEESDGDLAAWRSPAGVGFATAILHDDAPGNARARELGIVEDGSDDLFTILFTSGSTGTPKGALVSRRRWAEEICSEVDLWPYVGASFQPSAIAGDRGAVWRALTNGGRVGFARRGAELFHDLAAIRPTLFDVPPVVWNTLYGEYRRALDRPDLDRAEVAAIRRRFRNALGGRVAFLATGGAPSDEGVRRTMAGLFGVAMAEGYGTTETGFVARNGTLLPGVEVRLLDRPELGYTAADRPLPRGELAVRTPRTTARYLDEASGANEAFTADGFFRTGDLVELGPGRKVRILGRAQLTFKLAGAELVSPEELERVYRRSDSVEQIWIAAAPGAARVVAVVVPRSEAADERSILAELRRLAEEAGLRAHERPGAVVLAPRVAGRSPWTVENGLLTPSFKLHRRALAERYREALAERPREPHAAPEVPGLDASAAERLRAVAAAILRRPLAEVDLDRSFAEQGGDSLAALELAMRLEEVFGGKDGLDATLRDSGEAIARRPLRDLARRLELRGATSGTSTSGAVASASPSISAGRADESPPPAAPPDASAREGDSAELALAHRDALDGPRWLGDLPRATSPDVLVTGATGFLGIHLLDQLARSLPAGARIFALVRAADDTAAVERLRSGFAAAGLAAPPVSPASAAPGDGAARVVALAGRLDAERFGLAPERWERLAREVGLVHHLAASVTGAGRYSDLRAANVVGTRRALELATTATAKAFHLVSSLNVSLLVAGPGQGIAAEATALPGSLTPETFAANPAYAVTKWASERLVQELVRASGGAFRASISRPALLSWSLATGFANDHDWLTRVLLSCLVTRSIPGPPEAAVPSWVVETESSLRGLDLVPVDFAATAIALLGDLAATGATPGEPGIAPVFHVSNLAAGERGLVTMPRLLDLLIAAELEARGERGEDASPLAVVTPAEWRSRVETAGAPALPLLDRLRQSIPSLPRTPSERFRAAVGARLPDSGIDARALAAFVRRHAAQAAAEPADATIPAGA